MLGRLLLCVSLVLALSSVSFAGGIAVAVPSCQVQAVQVQAVQAYAPVQVAVPVYSHQVQVQAVQAVRVQQVQLVQANKHVRVQVVNQPRTALGAAIKAFRDQRFGR